MSSDNLHQLLAAASDAPEEDAPRLAVADWLEAHGQGERAEIIRLQCARARLPAYDPEHQQLKHREETWLQRFGNSWHGETPAGWYLNFERGLLFAQMNWRELTRPPGSVWWASQSDWVIEVAPQECDDNAVTQLIPRIQNRPGLHLRSDDVTDAVMPSIARLSRLRILALSGRQLTDVGLEALASMGELRELRLSSSRSIVVKGARRGTFTEAGIRHLTTMSGLRRLMLVEAGMTDANWRDLAKLVRLRELILVANLTNGIGLGVLSELPDLQVLDLSDSPVNDAGVSEMRGLMQLRRLNLEQSLVTDAGVAALAGLDRLQELVLGRCRRLTDLCLRHVGQLSKLRSLSLRSTHVTDAGLKELAGLQELRRLSLHGSRVTEAGIETLRRELPQCRILA